MNLNEKIYMKHYAVYTTEDIFCHGEVGKTCCAWTSRDNPVKGRFNTIEDALRAVCEANYFDYVPANCLNMGKDMPEEAGRKRLWSCQLSVYLGVCAERDLTPEEVASWER